MIASRMSDKRGVGAGLGPGSVLIRNVEGRRWGVDIRKGRWLKQWSDTQEKRRGEEIRESIRKKERE